MISSISSILLLSRRRCCSATALDLSSSAGVAAELVEEGRDAGLTRLDVRGKRRKGPGPAACPGVGKGGRAKEKTRRRVVAWGRVAAMGASFFFFCLRSLSLSHILLLQTPRLSNLVYLGGKFAPVGLKLSAPNLLAQALPTFDLAVARGCRGGGGGISAEGFAFAAARGGAAAAAAAAAEGGAF